MGNSLKEYINLNFNNVRNLSEFLSNIGKVPKGTDLSCIHPILHHKNDDLRLQAVKTIGKLESLDYLNILMDIALTDSSTMVRREAVSSIGRMKDKNTIPYLIELLSSEDPKIICQAIRGLLVFKGDTLVDEELKTLRNHPNETISKVIEKEFFVVNKKKKDTKPHNEVLPYLKNVVVNGDVLEVLENVPEDSVHLTFTSPPYYNARDYSIYTSYDEYLHFLKKVFTETYRITKEGRFFILNTSPIIVPRISRAHSSKRYPIPFDLNTILQEIGWEFIDDIIWMKPEYSVKNRIGGFQQHRKPLGYKPNNVTEYLMVYRKSTDKLIDWNMKQYSAEIICESRVNGPYETTNVWQISPKSDKVHSAIFPEALCERVIQYYSYKGDLIFDPFGGSGTLARVAKSLGRTYFTTEKEPLYFKYIQEKMMSTLFKSSEDHFLSLDEFKKTTL
ncbi:MAG: HEAT repeat domain-containing protein [Alistipes sp.]|nr:HEAT repeat domain-containing protein [Alistipes sp.]